LIFFWKIRIFLISDKRFEIYLIYPLIAHCSMVLVDMQKNLLKVSIAFLLMHTKY